jgi:hypothetical protein
MIRAHDLPEPVIQCEAARQKAVSDLAKATATRNGEIAACRREAQLATLAALRAEADAGHVVIPRKLPTPAEMKAATDAYKVAAHLANLELRSWKQALAESLAGRIGAFSVGFCRKRIREISYAIARAKAAPLLDKIRL